MSLKKMWFMYLPQKRRGEDASPDGVAKDDVNLEGPEQASIESSQLAHLQTSASKTSDTTAGAATPTLAYFLCGRAAPAGIRSTVAATSVSDAVMQKCSDASVEGAASNLVELHVQRSAGTLLKDATPTPSAMSAEVNTSGRNVKSRRIG